MRKKCFEIVTGYMIADSMSIPIIYLEKIDKKSEDCNKTFHLCSNDVTEEVRLIWKNKLDDDIGFSDVTNSFRFTQQMSNCKHI